MTRYEIILGIVPPPEPPKRYYMGADLGIRGNTVCALCYRENEKIWVERIDSIPPGRSHLLQHSMSFNLTGIATDDHTSRIFEVRRNLYDFRNQIFFRERNRDFEDLPEIIASGDWFLKKMSAKFSNAVDALARATWLIARDYFSEMTSKLGRL